MRFSTKTLSNRQVSDHDRYLSKNVSKLASKPTRSLLSLQKGNVSVDPHSLISITHLFKTQQRSRNSRESRRCSSWGKHKTQRINKKLSGKYGHPETPVKKGGKEHHVNKTAAQQMGRIFRGAAQQTQTKSSKTLRRFSQQNTTSL